MTLILGIETSCDDTCAAVVDGDGRVRSDIVSSQVRFHERFGGVVPEIAARHHLELIGPAIDAALADAGLEGPAGVDAVAVTAGPGLVGALLVGVATAKGLAWAAGRPLVAIDHLDAHVLSPTLAPDGGEAPVAAPYVCLLASGGHTQLWHVREAAPGCFERDLLADTRDDAAGEAFDKGARLLDLPHPGGPALEALARDGDPAAVTFPRPFAGRLAFSFSGLKTALRYAVRDGRGGASRADLAASYQAAIVDSLIDTAELALEATGAPALALAGGVAANGPLRDAAEALARRRGVRAAIPARRHCTDNAAMVANAARFATATPWPAFGALDATPTGSRSRPTAALAT